MSGLPAISAEEYAELPRRDKSYYQDLVVEAARHDPNVFAQYVFKVKNQPFHRYLHSIIDSKSRKNTWDAPVESGKSTQVTIIRPTYDIGRNVHEMIALVSASPDLTRSALKVIRGHILENERLHRVFPHLKLVEKTKSSLTVERPRSTAKDPSLIAMGIEGAILGRRWTKLVTDDVLRFATTWTEHERGKTWARMQREMIPRLTKNATHTDIGTPWVGSDARHKLRRVPGYVFLRFDGWTGDVFDREGRKVRSFEGGLWTEPTIDPVTGMEFGWTRARLEDARRSMAGHEFDRQVRCIALSEAMQIWGQHLEACQALGRGIRLQEESAFNNKVRIAWRRPEPSWRTVFTGVDLAIEKHEASHDTAFFTGVVADRQKHILELRRGKIEGPDIVRNMIEIVRKYPLHVAFRVETNQGQKFLKQFVDEPGVLEALGASSDEAARIQIIPQQTGKNKAAEHVGVRSMNMDFERRRWPIPCDDDLGSCDLVQEWIDGLKAFDPVSHADDMVMASWLFWEQTREFGGGNGSWEKFGIFVP